MKRRDFLIASAGTLGALSPALVRSQTIPCPLSQVTIQGGQTVNAVCISNNLALSQACAALSAGQWTNFPAGAQAAFSEADLAWQTSFYHDDANGLIHLMGKPANDDSAWKHQYYTLTTNQWTVVSTAMWSNPGHIYGNMSIDWTTGDIYQVRGGADSASGRDNYRRAARWIFSSRQWTYTTTDIYSGAFESHANGVAWHPNLYGPGDGGLVWDTQQRVCFWRKSNGAVQNVSHTYLGDKEGIGEYWPAMDKVIVGGSDSGQLAFISANGGGTPTVTPLGTPPIRTAGNSHLSGGGFGSLHVHPGNVNKLIILERGGSRRVFTSTNGTAWTAAGTHPFTPDPFVVCSLRGSLGALWAIGRVGSTQLSMLWKPNP